MCSIKISHLQMDIVVWVLFVRKDIEAVSWLGINRDVAMGFHDPEHELEPR